MQEDNLLSSLLSEKGMLATLAPIAIGALTGRTTLGLVGTLAVPVLYREANDWVFEQTGFKYPFFDVFGASETTPEPVPEGVLWYGLDVPLINGDVELTKRFLDRLNTARGSSMYDRLAPEFIFDISTPVGSGIDTARVMNGKHEGTFLSLYHIGLVMSTGTPFCLRYAGVIYTLPVAESLFVVNYSKSFSAFGEAIMSGAIGLLPSGRDVPLPQYISVEEINVTVVLDNAAAIEVGFINSETTNTSESCTNSGYTYYYYDVISDIGVADLFNAVIDSREVRIKAATQDLANAAWGALVRKYASGNLAVHFEQYGYSTWTGDTSVAAASMSTYQSWWEWTCDTEIP